MSDADKVSITFTETKVVDDHRKGSSAEERFEAGKTYDLSPRSADRWVKRGAAHFTTPEDAAKAAGASSDVSLRLQDSDRFDPLATRAPAEGSGQATLALGGEGGGKEAGGDEKTDYSHMKGPELKDLIKSRGLELNGASKNAEFITILERNDKVTAAVAAKDWDVLHVEELKDIAEKDTIDLTGKSTKADIIAAFDEHYKAAE
jgi:hypothetical protein